MRMLALVVVLAGCSFSPDIGDGTIACAPDRSCPPGFVCGQGARCFHLAGPDAADPDAAASDACHGNKCKDD